MRYLILIFLVYANLALADPPDNYPFVSYDVGLQQAREENKPIFVYFGRLGCGFCAKTNKETFTNAALKKLYTSKYILVYVDAESGERLTLPNGERITEAELGARLNVFATPIFLYLDKTGKVLFRAPGYKTVEDFRAFDGYVRGGFYKTMSINDYLARR
jgi:thioredoxin-related protein